MLHLVAMIALAGCFRPAQGTWTTSNGEITTTTCAERDQHPVRDGAELTIALIDASSPQYESGAFRMRMEGDPAFGCSTSGRSFSCGTHREDVDASEDFEDATLHLEIALDGAFIGEVTLTGHRYVDITCEGADCSDVVDEEDRVVPCATTAGFDATWTSTDLPGASTDDTDDTEPVD